MERSQSSHCVPETALPIKIFHMLRMWATYTLSMSEMYGTIRRSQSELKASYCCFHEGNENNSQGLKFTVQLIEN